MLIAYRTTTGEVVINTGTSSAWPEGPPDEWAHGVLADQGIAAEDVRFLRLHDQEDATLVGQIMEPQRFHVDPATDKVVLDGPYPVYGLTASQDTIKAGDARSYSVVTYTGDEASVTFLINGLAQDETLIDGTAEIEVAASVPGEVVVSANGYTLTITAEA